MQENNLITSTNLLKGALPLVKGDKEYHYSSRTVARYLNIGCSTLSDLLEDDETLGLISAGNEMAPKERMVFVLEYMDAFIAADRTLLIKAGMDRIMASSLFSDVRAIKQAISSGGRISREDLATRLRRIRTIICVEGRDLSAEVRLNRMINIIGGAAIAVTNTAAVAPIQPLFAVASGIWGRHLIKQGSAE